MKLINYLLPLAILAGGTDVAAQERMPLPNGYSADLATRGTVYVLSGLRAGTVQFEQTPNGPKLRGNFTAEMNPKALEQIVKEADVNKDKTITEAEAQALIQKMYGEIMQKSGMAPKRAEPAVKPAPAQPPRKLYVNTSGSRYEIEKSRAEGESDLYALTTTASTEEAWLFLKYKDGRQVWKEIGQSGTEEDAKVEFTVKDFNDPDDIAELTFYHLRTEDLRSSNFTESETPSLKDFNAYVKSAYWMRHWFPQLMDRMDFKAVVNTGTYTIRISSGNLDDEDIKSDSFTKLSEMENARADAINSERNFNYSKRNRKNFARENARFAERFSNRLFGIRFTPRQH